MVLFGLLWISLLVTTALITATLELSMSSAHQTATRTLYEVEAGLMEYLTRPGLQLEPASAVEEVVYAPGSGLPPLSVSVVHLGAHPRPGQGEAQVYSVTAMPAGGGRSLGVLVRQESPPPLPFPARFTAVVQVGGGLRVDGAGTRISGSAARCGGDGVPAVLAASSSALEVAPATIEAEPVLNGTLANGEEVFGLAAIARGGDPAELAAGLLTGHRLVDIAAEVLPEAWAYRSRDPLASTSWISGALGPPGGVAILDAEGGTVVVGPGLHAGLLIVLNGDVELTDNSTYEGIILAEGHVRLAGNLTVRGAVAALGTDAHGGARVGESSIGPGVQIQYDFCAVEAAGEAYGARTAAGRRPRVTEIGSWLELVR